MDPNKFSKQGLMKKLQGKYISKSIANPFLKAHNLTAGDKRGLKSAIVSDLKYQSPTARTRLYKKMGMDSKTRGRLENEILTVTKSAFLLKKEQKIIDRKKAANIKMGRAMDENMKKRRGGVDDMAEDSSRLGIAGADYKNTASGGNVSSQDLRGGSGSSSGGSSGYANNPTSGGLTRGSGGAAGIGQRPMSGGGGGMPSGGGAPLGF